MGKQWRIHPLILAELFKKAQIILRSKPETPRSALYSDPGFDFFNFNQESFPFKKNEISPTWSSVSLARPRTSSGWNDS